MSDVSSLGGGGTQSLPYVTSPVASVAFPAGTPVYKQSTGMVAPAIASAIGTSTLLGLAVNPAQPGQPVDIQWGGSVKLSNAQWQQVLGTSSGGLTTGSQYYLSESVAGRLTTVPPTNEAHFIVQVGVAEFIDSMFIQLGAPQAGSSIP